VKHRLVHALQKYLLNPPVKLLLALGAVPPSYALLETRGRRSGKPRRTPVGNGLVGDTFWIVAEHGSRAGYVRNIRHDPRVRLKLREGVRLRWREGTAQVLPDDDPLERQRALARGKPGRRLNAFVVRTMGTELLTVRIDLDGQSPEAPSGATSPLS
jgi:deazaflavin-dependent oxidoreductase (nitroreductase family)